jgi:hypothetical protein
VAPPACTHAIHSFNFDGTRCKSACPEETQSVVFGLILPLHGALRRHQSPRYRAEFRNRGFLFSILAIGKSSGTETTDYMFHETYDLALLPRIKQSVLMRAHALVAHLKKR